MKNFLFTLTLAVISLAPGFAQPSLQWAATLNGPIANDEGKAIALDAAGNVYVTASSDGLSGTSDFLTIKYGKNGNLIWSKRYEYVTNGQDSARAIRVDAMGNVYVTGKSHGNGNSINMVTIKYDSTGLQKWASVYSGVSYDNGAYSLEVDVYGNVYVIGSANSHNILLKYNGSGVLQWSRNLTNSYSSKNEIYLAISPFDGNLIVADGGSLTSNYYIWKLHPSTGNVVQTYNTGSNGGNVIYGIPNSLVVDATGNMYVTSMSDPDLNTDKPSRIYTAKFTQGSDTYAWYHYTYISGNIQTITCVDMKIDKNSNLYVLAKWYTGSGYVFFSKMLTSSGSLVWAKPINSSDGTDGTPVSISLSQLSTPPEIYETGFTSNGNIKIVKYTNGGDTLWTKTYDCGNNGVDIVSKMTLDACDNIYLTGSSNCNGAYKDIKTVKYSTITATITANGPTTFCQGGSVILTSSQSNSYLWSTGATTQSITVSNTGTYTVTITSSGSCTAVSSATQVTVNPTLAASVSITGPSTICAGQNAVFNATSVNGGTAQPKWFVNSAQVGTGSTYSSTTLTNGAQVYCTLTSTATCASPATATSNTISVTVNPTLTASVSITGPTTICANQNATFTASPINGGTAQPNWFVNNMLVGTGPSYSTTTLSNGAQVYCTLSTTAPCTTPATATSNTISVTVNPILTASVSITGPSSICANQNATFTAAPINGGSAQPNWYVNNVLVGTGLNFSTTTLSNGAQVYCTLASTAPCATPATATSNTITVTVSPIVNANVSITGPTALCANQNATFIATPINGGSALPNWFVNNVPVGTGLSYSTTTLTNGAQVYCNLTSTIGCAVPVTATSNTITVTINPVLTPGISITGTSVVCSGQNASFAATAINGGSSPAYQWFLNNTLVGTNQTYSTAAPANGDQIYCILTSNALCAATTTATSPTTVVTVLALPNAQITSNDPTSFCAGGNAVLTASPSGTYKWSTGQSTKSITVASSGNYIVTVTVANGCSASSAPVAISVFPLPPIPNIFPSGPVHLCEGEEAILTSSFANSYQWSTGETTQSITVSSSGNFTVTTSDLNNCATSSAPTIVTWTATAQPSISLSVTCLDNEATVTATPVDGGPSPTYTWWVQGIQQMETGPVLNVIDGLHSWVATCRMTSNATCLPPSPFSEQKEIELNCITSAGETLLLEGFRVTPNPSAGSFTTEFFLPEAKMVTQRVLNVLGQVVWNTVPAMETGTYTRSIDLGAGVMPGIYFLETRLDDSVFLWRIIVQ